MAAAIRIENLSKVYLKGITGTGTIGRDLGRWYARVRGREDPYLRVGDAGRPQGMEKEAIWALQGIHVQIEQGDKVGIMGTNGAGKSTLLKILSRITAPTGGEITGCGRIVSLLEIGTGFHPDLSGRENIYLNAAMLGMRRRDIKARLDEVLNFAELEDFADTPVKRYSSGMYMRLAFAAAVHLEAEILIVDEILAVGDVSFRNKCLSKLNDVNKKMGRTVLLVSHQLQNLAAVCNKGIVLKNGTSDGITDIEAAVQSYSTYQTDFNGNK